LFVGKTDEARHVLEEVREKRIARQIEPDGRQPLELERTKSWGYSIFNLRALFCLATVGERLGIDLWHFETPDGRSIRKALDFMIPFALKETKWPYRQLGQFPNQDLFPLIRQAALKYPEGQYKDLLPKLRAIDSASRTRLLQRGADGS